jgi:hypothetical protein
MAVTVKPVTLWRKEVENRPGELARTLEPLARAGADLQVIMGYRYPGNETRAAIELYPVRGKKSEAAALAAGLSAAAIPALHVEGDNRPGVAYAISQALADAGINMSFQVAQSVGRRFAATFGFDNEADARRAAAIIKKAAVRRRQ